MTFWSLNEYVSLEEGAVVKEEELSWPIKLVYPESEAGNLERVCH